MFLFNEIWNKNTVLIYASFSTKLWVPKTPLQNEISTLNFRFCVIYYKLCISLISLTHSLNHLLNFPKQDTNMQLHFWLKRYYDNYITYQKLEYNILTINSKENQPYTIMWGVLYTHIKIMILIYWWCTWMLQRNWWSYWIMIGNGNKKSLIISRKLNSYVT